MLHNDADMVLCDCAETYGIYDLQAVPVTTLARLVFGLSDNSRIKRKLSGQKIDLQTMLLAHIADSLAFIAWSKTKDAEHGRNRPQSILEKLTKEEEPQERVRAFTTGADFDRARAEIVKRTLNNGD